MRHDMVAAGDEHRHRPGPRAGALWNESWWFSWYDPVARVGFVSRIGLLPCKGDGEANAWAMCTREDRLVHSGNSIREPLPGGDPGAGLAVAGLTYTCREPHRRWRMAYRAADGTTAVEGEWTSTSPAFGYALAAPGPGMDVPGRLEQSGRFRGSVTLGGERVEVDAVAHRDHSWGAERDWSVLGNWAYVHGEFPDGFAFNAIQVPLPGGFFFRLGYVCVDGELRAANELEVEVELSPEGTQHRGARLWLADETGERHQIEGRCLVNCPADVGATLVNDAISELRCRGLTGYGVIEWGYQKG